jgi:hypothetical protein
MANKIKFNGTGDGVNDSEIHFTDPITDYTLCGLTLDGDPQTAGGFDITKEKVNCEHCIRMVKYCKTIKSTEYKK